MEILVLGGEGNLGHKMFQLLRARYPDKAFTIRGSLSDPLYARVPLFRDIAVIEKVDAMDLHALGDLPPWPKAWDEFAPDLARCETMLRKAAREGIGELLSKGQDPGTAM